MVKLNKIYTRTGDDGTTGLVDGSRLRKSNPRIEAYGTIDEANATIGIARLYIEQGSMLDVILLRIQNDFFDLGADLATPLRDDNLQESHDLRIVAAQVSRIEQEIDVLNQALEPLRSFILPAGSHASAYLHLARTITRRAERAMVGLQEVEAINLAALHYVNRVSDLLFVAARYANNDKGGDVLWVPGENR
ncbi:MULTISPECIES: cob(I)yrinic acid a,c-diamide adenosyltransferase [unclassified Bartonella]|uniref:cob(I)yrinic acid a,c-diamide adenosyltransferase n=1 Tax=unclassified Bartonella TaxID=2645622 RepID=UPI0021C7CFC9|nr:MULTISPECIES: cob(I)yrinic acid a,c-diamide adenosyltransferase [unclassified Bartonella]UXN03373.1 cob(I)yrinic acid a,c-diamide adenosyltransferase [Bartonella sp. HY406]UXN06330.1 cob(I)yrinic acid a,c-diamide adenosyltransferase [Bartonella sp. HY761]